MLVRASGLSLINTDFYGYVNKGPVSSSCPSLPSSSVIILLSPFLVIFSSYIYAHTLSYFFAIFTFRDLLPFVFRPNRFKCS